MTIQSPTNPLPGLLRAPSLRMVFGTLLEKFLESRQRKADREIARHLRNHKELEREYRFERDRFMVGQ